MVDERGMSVFGGSNQAGMGGYLQTSSNKEIAQIQSDIIQICGGHTQLTMLIYEVIGRLNEQEGFIFSRTIHTWMMQLQNCGTEDERIAFQMYLQGSAPRLMGQLRGVTDVTMNHIMTEMQRSLRPPEPKAEPKKRHWLLGG